MEVKNKVLLRLIEETREELNFIKYELPINTSHKNICCDKCFIRYDKCRNQWQGAEVCKGPPVGLRDKLNF